MATASVSIELGDHVMTFAVEETTSLRVGTSLDELGQCHLHLNADFKDGVTPTWIKKES